FVDSMSVIVKPEVAKAQQAVTQGGPGGQPGGTPGPGQTGPLGPGGGKETGKPGRALPKRFYGTVSLDPDRAGRDTGKIAEEILAHLTTLPRSRVRVTLEIEAELPEGADETVQRTVTENCAALKFTDFGF